MRGTGVAGVDTETWGFNSICSTTSGASQKETQKHTQKITSPDFKELFSFPVGTESLIDLSSK